jgi:hypothetical protein
MEIPSRQTKIGIRSVDDLIALGLVRHLLEETRLDVAHVLLLHLARCSSCNDLIDFDYPSIGSIGSGSWESCAEFCANFVAVRSKRPIQISQGLSAGVRCTEGPDFIPLTEPTHHAQSGRSLR